PAVVRMLMDVDDRLGHGGKFGGISDQCSRRQSSHRGEEFPSVVSVDADGRPTQRAVLLKHWDKSGFVFYTNKKSRKAVHIRPTRRHGSIFSGSNCNVKSPSATASNPFRSRKPQLTSGRACSAIRSALGIAAEPGDLVEIPADRQVGGTETETCGRQGAIAIILGRLPQGVARV
ncbi:MAG: pyridoxamine 5'-phosphate oxidase family protein, partial [Opitutaceae bacterium]|nr:pyridoxamine 5'-phosphate oxidase family protein [Verrucomicrobiales bacterium]